MGLVCCVFSVAFVVLAKVVAGCGFWRPRWLVVVTLVLLWHGFVCVCAVSKLFVLFCFIPFACAKANTRTSKHAMSSDGLRRYPRLLHILKSSIFSGVWGGINMQTESHLHATRASRIYPLWIDLSRQQITAHTAARTQFFSAGRLLLKCSFYHHCFKICAAATTTPTVANGTVRPSHLQCFRPTLAHDAVCHSQLTVWACGNSIERSPSCALHQWQVYFRVSIDIVHEMGM